MSPHRLSSGSVPHSALLKGQQPGRIVAVLMLALLAGSAAAVPPPGALTSRPRLVAPAPAKFDPNTEVRTKAGERRRLALPDGSALYVNENTTVRLQAPGALSLTAGEVFIELVPTAKHDSFVVRAGNAAVVGKDASFAVRLDLTGPAVDVTRGKVEIQGAKDALHAGEQLVGGTVQPAARASHALAWVHDLMCADEAPLVPPNQHAGGALIAIDPRGQEAKLALRRYHIDVYIEDGFARTTIDQTYFNHENEQLEGTFFFPLPPDASLSRLAMYVNGHLMEGGMAERDYARTVYETIRYTRRDPALLEWVDGSTFKMRVFPLEPRQEKRIVLSYSQRLPSLYGRLTYRFPAGHTLQKVRDWSVHARVKDGAGWPWHSASHELRAQDNKKDLVLSGATHDTRTDRDVVLTLTDPRANDPGDEVVQFATAEHEGAKYLLTRFRPRLTGKAAARRRDSVFLVETSGDRDPLLARVQIEVLRSLLGYAEPGDTFTVLAAGTRVQPLSKELVPLTPENIAAAITFLEGAHLIGALDLGQALTEAGTYLQKAADPHLVHLGSGIAAMGERSEDNLARRVPKGTTYIGVGVGRRWGRGLMKTAAELTGGLFTQINPDEPIAWRSFELVSTVNTPRLLNVRVTDREGKAIFLPFGTAVAQGEEVAAITRVEGKDAVPSAVVVTGTLDGKPFERTLPVQNAKAKADYLPRTWAKLEIDRLLAEHAVKHKDTIIALSKAMYVITPFTSLLVLENEDQYTQYRVDRGRKDHWALYPLPANIPVVTEPDPDAPDALQAKAGKLPIRKVLPTLAMRGQGAPAAKQSNWSLLTGLTVEGKLKDFQLGMDVNANGLGDWFARSDLMGAGPPPAPAPLKMPADAKEEGKREVEQLFGWTHLPEAELAPVRRRADVGGKKLKALASLGESLDELEQALDDRVAGLHAEVALPELGRPPVERLLKEVEEFREAKKGVPHPGFGGFAAGGSTPAGGATFFGRSAATRARAAKRNLVHLAWYAIEDTKATAKPQADGDEYLDLLGQIAWMPQRDLTYQRPSYTPSAEVFYDLVAYAPGLNTSAADVLGVLDAEALPGAWNRPGTVEPAARALIAKAQSAGWQTLTVRAQGGMPAFTVHFDGSGRFAYERVLPFGLRERVVCDGKTLTHVYPQLALAARRDVSRFHRAALAASVPWFVPPAEDLARGANVRLAGERTVAIIPHGAGMKTADNKVAPYHVVQLVFAADGRLAERRVVRMPAGEVAARLTLTADGAARLLDGKGKELSATVAKLASAPAPELTAATQDLLVLPMPYRTPEHVRKVLKLENKNIPQLTLKEALPLFLAYVAQGNANEADQVFRQVFHAREQRQLGFYVLLASCGVNLDSDHGNVLAEHLDEPLAQYLALHTSPVLRKHASQWAVGSGSWQDGFLQHLAVTHALLQRWQDAKVLKGDPARVAAETRRALDYVRKHHDSAFGWALLCLIQDRADHDAALHGKLAELWALFAEQPGLSYAARYEEARSWWRAGKEDDARKQFRTLHEWALKEGALPSIDGEFRAALLAGDAWGEMVRQTARKLVDDKRRVAVLALARQCWDIDDQPLAGQLLTTALDGIGEPAQRTAMALAAFAFLRDTHQLPEADNLLQSLLADPQLARQRLLWRLGHALAKERDMPARAVECLERALDLEAERPPEIIDLEATRADYGALLGHYANLADAMVALKLAPPPDFLSRVVRAADRWRAVESDPAAACQAAAKVLKRLGQRELAWDYLTTPVGVHVGESSPWWGLAEELAKQGELDLADRAYRAAGDYEPTNAQILWDRMQNLKRLARPQEAQQILRRLAAGPWQPRFQGLQAQAKHLLQGQE